MLIPVDGRGVVAHAFNAGSSPGDFASGPHHHGERGHGGHRGETRGDLRGGQVPAERDGGQDQRLGSPDRGGAVGEGSRFIWCLLVSGVVPALRFVFHVLDLPAGRSCSDRRSADREFVEFAGWSPIAPGPSVLRSFSSAVAGQHPRRSTATSPSPGHGGRPGSGGVPFSRP